MNGLKKMRRNNPVFVKVGSKWKLMDSMDLYDFAFSYGGFDGIDSVKANTPCGLAKAISKHIDMEWCPSKVSNGYAKPDFDKVRR